MALENYSTTFVNKILDNKHCTEKVLSSSGVLSLAITMNKVEVVQKIVSHPYFKEQMLRNTHIEEAAKNQRILKLLLENQFFEINMFADLSRYCRTQILTYFIKDISIRNQAITVIDAIGDPQGSQEKKELNNLTFRLLLSSPGANRKKIVKEYNNKAMKISGNPSPIAQAIGVAMMSLGAMVYCAGIIFGVVILSTSFGLGAPAAVGLIVGGISSSSILLTIGHGLFKVGRHKGLSKEMTDTSEIIPEDSTALAFIC
jgi:hypothetical protein